MKALTLIVAGLALAAWAMLLFLVSANAYNLHILRGFSVGDLVYLAVPLLGLASTGALAASTFRAGGDGRLLWLGASFILAMFLIVVSQASRAG